MMVHIRAFFMPRHMLALESVALRQQLAVFKRKQPRPGLNRLDWLLLIALRRWYSGWANALILVKPEPVGPGTVLASVCFSIGGPGPRSAAEVRPAH